MNQHIPLKKCLNCIIASLILIISVSEKSFAVAKTFNVAGGVWSNPGHWNPAGVPVAGDVITIAANGSVDISTAIIGSLVINTGCTLTVMNLPGATLSINGPITVNTGATLDNQGNIDVLTPFPYQAFTLTGTATYTHNPRVPEEVIFENSNENFSQTSTLNIRKWFDEAVPLCAPNKVNSGTLGNLYIDIGPVIWDQDGWFSNGGTWTNHRIWGSLTINNTKVVFDDGTGLSTGLTLQDVTLSGTAIALFQTGSPRPFTLITGNFTDNSTLTTDTSCIMYNTYGTLTWTVNGSLTLAHNFSLAVDSLLGPAMPNATVTVNGNATFSSGAINFIKQKNSNLTMTVTGTTTIGAVSKFRMIDGYTGALSFTTGNLVISGGNDNVFMGSGDISIPKATGAVTVNVTNDFSVTGTTSTYILNSDTNIAKCRVTAATFNMSPTAANLRIANSNGAMTFKTTGNFTITGGNFTGQLLPVNISIDTLSIGGNFLFNSPVATNYLKVTCGGGNTVLATTGNFYLQNSGSALGQGVYGIYGDKTQTGSLTMTVGGQYRQDLGRFNGIYDGAGNMTFSSTTQPFLMNNGDFRGIYNPDTTNAGNTTFSLNGMSFNGGTWMMHYGVNTTSATAILTVTNNCAINFASATDQFMIIGLPYVSPANNTLLLSSTIGGSLSIAGANGSFVSSKSGGDETITITGDFSIGAGNNSFNITQNSGFAFGHAVTLNLSGNLNISGGTTFLSAEYGTATATISGNMNVTGGTFSIKGAGGFSAHNFNVNGNYIQSAGTIYLHNNTLSSTNASVNVTINSDFTHSGGTIYFDNNPSLASAAHVLNIKGANYNLSGAGVITSASPGTGPILGQINFSRAGTTNYNRVLLSTHDVQQARQYILAGTTLVVNTGNLQVASYTTIASPYSDIFSVQFGGILDLKANQIYSNATQATSIVEVRSTGRVRLQNPFGLYDGTPNAAISSVGNMNYNLSGGSVVEYYGVANQVLTGIGPGIATLAQHKYGILDINLPAGTQYVHVSSGTDSVFIRSTLNMKAGELCLDNDHVGSNGGGKTVTIESPVTTAITVIAGLSYIRSETEDGSGKIKWKMGAVTGAHVVPFGMDAAPANISLPVTYNPPAGTTGDVTFATYHTNSLNLPYPPTVNHVNDLSGANNGLQTVDRFWNITVSGTTPPAPTLTFFCTANEALGVATPLRAQKWMFPQLAWSFPLPGVSQNNPPGPTAFSAQVVSSAIQTGWWTLSSLSSPLPVEFLDFSANCEGKGVRISWNTATETNNDHFTIERSRDGNKFEFFKMVKGAGNSSSSSEYEIFDKNPFKGKNYYRISQTDYNGHTEVFKTASSSNCTSDDSELQLVVALDDQHGTSLLVTSPANEDFVVDVFDASGKKVLTQKNSVQKGFNELSLFTKNLNSGVYIVKLIGDSHILTQKFFVTGN